MIYDRRDFEPDPTKGVYLEIANEFSNKAIGSQYNFNKLFLQARSFTKLPFGKRKVLAGRVGVGNIFGFNAPFFEFKDQWSPEGSISVLGGKHLLRGYRANRLLMKSLWLTNLELRYEIAHTKLGTQNCSFGVAPFFDVGTVRDRWQDVNFKNIKFSYGAGARIGWNQSVTIFFTTEFPKKINYFTLVLGRHFDGDL